VCSGLCIGGAFSVGFMILAACPRRSASKLPIYLAPGDAARRIMPPVSLLAVHAGLQLMQREIFGPLGHERALQEPAGPVVCGQPVDS
jgi:hypothetical protein